MFDVKGYEWFLEILLQSTDLINQRIFSLMWMKYLSRQHQALIILPG